MTRYYTQHLSARRLQAVYDLAPPETVDYLEAEIAFVKERVRPGASVLELGCGYGRVIQRLLPVAGSVTGIDNSPANIEYAVEFLERDSRISLAVMDAVSLGFRERTFDLTICIQNGICAFRVDKEQLLREALRVTKPGGMVLLSSYAARFWPHRLKWFEIQSAHGLLGPIDYAATGHGVIACTDGFRTTTMTPDDFCDLEARVGVEARITEVAGSSLFLELHVAPE
jgi:2-polyprenyl-6-hydroxyphenyl methylase/3-demethylubiquinone-9 3-methyltransferase